MIEDVERYFPDLVPFFDKKPFRAFVRKKLADALEIDECPEVDKWAGKLCSEQGLEFDAGYIAKALYTLQREGWILLHTTTSYPVVGTFRMSKNKITQYMREQVPELEEIVRYRKMFYCGDEEQAITCDCYGYPLKAISSSPNPVCSEQKKTIGVEMPSQFYLPRIETAITCKKRLEMLLLEANQNQKNLKKVRAKPTSH